MPFAFESERFSWCLLQNATINPSMQNVGAVVDQLRIEIKDKQMQKGKKKEKLPASTRRRKKARSKRYWNNFLETLLHFDNTVRHWGSSVWTATLVCPSSFKQNFQLGSYAHLFFFFWSELCLYWWAICVGVYSRRTKTTLCFPVCNKFMALNDH